MTGTRFKAYPEYKISGIEWLGKIPAHWEIFRLHYLADVVDPQPDHRAPAILEVGGFPYVGIRDLRSDGTVNTDTARQVSEEAVVKQEASFSINEGDIVFCKVGTLGLPRLIKPHCRLALSATLVLVKPHLHRLSRFLRYALDAPGTYAQISLASTGSTRSALGIEQIRRFSIPFTSDLEEASYIADFLDRETTKIDALVEKKQRLIELLQEKRTALITHAVTKGLDPNVPMRNSGIEWLGQIPVHWEPVRIKNVADMRAGTAITSEAIDESGQYPVYGGNGLRGYTSSFTHEGEYVLVGRQGALCGNINYASGKFWASEHAVVATPLGTVNVRWLGEVLRSMRLNELSVAAAQPGLAVDRILSQSIALPPNHEQRKIADFLDRETTKLDTLIAKVREAIERLKEYRTALISAAVTGKIDVRNE